MTDIYDVSTVSDLIKCSIVGSLPDEIKVEGEISNVKLSGNHLYLTLKDSDSCLNVIFWRYSNSHSTLDLNNGEKIIVEGKINCYAKNSNYDITASSITKSGQGDIH